MERNELGQVVDRAALDASDGPRARIRVELPASVLTSGGEIAVAVPARLPCDRCDGGGCDACGRSGVLRAPAEESARSLRLRVPSGSGDGVALRLVRPFGDAATIEQLLIEVRPAQAPSPGVVCINTPAPRGLMRVPDSSMLARPSPLGRAPVAVLALLALAAALVAALASR